MNHFVQLFRKDPPPPRNILFLYVNNTCCFCNISMKCEYKSYICHAKSIIFIAHLYTTLAAALKNAKRIYHARKHFASEERKIMKLVKASKEETYKKFLVQITTLVKSNLVLNCKFF